MNMREIVAEIDAEIEKLQRARNALLGAGQSVGRKRHRRMSAEARARISAAQKARWAKSKQDRK